TSAIWNRVTRSSSIPRTATRSRSAAKTSSSFASAMCTRWRQNVSKRARPASTFEVMSPTVTPIAATDEQLADVHYDADGLVPAIVQEEESGKILMMAWMNEATLRQSLEEGRTVFWSRSRQEVWRKGDTSGDRQYIRSAHYDCDGDVLLF